MNLSPKDTDGSIEYRFLKFETHEKAEEALNQWTSDGWQLVSYQTAGWDMGILHFLLLSHRKQAETPRRLGL